MSGIQVAFWGPVWKGPTSPPIPPIFLQVVRHIRASSPRVLLIVMAQHVYDVARERQGDKAPLYPALDPGVRPRLCHIVKDEGGFGFSITAGKLLGPGSQGGRMGDPAFTELGKQAADWIGVLWG